MILPMDLSSPTWIKEATYKVLFNHQSYRKSGHSFVSYKNVQGLVVTLLEHHIIRVLFGSDLKVRTLLLHWSCVTFIGWKLITKLEYEPEIWICFRIAFKAWMDHANKTFSCRGRLDIVMIPQIAMIQPTMVCV